MRSIGSTSALDECHTRTAEVFFGCLGGAPCLGAAAPVIALAELLRWWDGRSTAPRLRRIKQRGAAAPSSHAGDDEGLHEGLHERPSSPTPR
jgi:hypothetical protein